MTPSCLSCPMLQTTCLTQFHSHKLLNSSFLQCSVHYYCTKTNQQTEFSLLNPCPYCVTNNPLNTTPNPSSHRHYSSLVKHKTLVSITSPLPLQKTLQIIHINFHSPLLFTSPYLSTQKNSSFHIKRLFYKNGLQTNPIHYPTTQC